MLPEVKGYIIAIVYGLLCIGLAFVLSKFSVPRRYCRKVVHILVGFEWVILRYYMGPTVHFLAVALAFTLLLAVAYFKKLFKMISSDDENAPGTVYYGVAMSIMSAICIFVPDMMLPFGIGVMCTSLGDGFAGVVGSAIKEGNPKIYRNKTLLGVFANFVVSFMAVFAFRYFFDMDIAIWQGLCIALLSVGLEIIGAFGLDNIMITVGISLFSYGLIYGDGLLFYLVPILLTPWIIVFVTKKNALTFRGLALAIVIDVAVSFSLGNLGFVILCGFFALSVLVDKINRLAKREDQVTKKGSCRDEIQVFANGMVPMVLAMLFLLTKQPAFLVGFVAALSEAFADTAASGFGAFSKKTFDPFRMCPIPCGLSGGMSLVGTVASLIAAFVLPTVAFFMGGMAWQFIFVCAGAAFLGVVFDSFLGSVLQIKFKCPACGIITEREVHCCAKTQRERGIAFFDNDVVNFLSGVFTAIVAAIACIIII